MEKLVGDVALSAIASDIKSEIGTKADAQATAEALATKADTSAVNSALATKADKSSVYTKTETDNKLSAKANTSDVDTALALKADKSNTYTKSEVNTALGTKANASDVYTKAQTDTALSGKADKSTTYTKSETDSLLSAKADTSAVNSALALKADKSDTYTKAQVDSALSTKANTSDLPDMSEYYDKTETDALIGNKADVDGTYDNMTVGNAKQLKSNVGEVDKVPYLFRPSGGSIDIGESETDSLVGGTVAFNQLVNPADFVLNRGITPVFNNSIISLSGTPTATFANFLKPSFLLIAGHVYIGIGEVIANPNNLPFKYALNNSEGGIKNGDMEFMCKMVTTKISGFGANTLDTTADYTGFQFKANLFDLTQMFGSAIADYIYSIENSNAGAGVAWFRNLFPKSYYAYNAGTLMSVKTSKHITTGFNAYDNSTGKAKVVGGNQYQITGTYTSLTLDGETITPNASGIFTPDTSGEITVVGGNATDTCIHLVWDGERNGEYEPYVKHEYDYSGEREVTRYFGYRDYESGDESLTDAITDGTHTVYKLATPYTETVSNPELRGIPKLDANNKLYYYGDTCSDLPNPQIVDDFGTEEYVDNREVVIPVGHDTFYQANLRAKLEMSPDSPSGDGDYIVRQTNGQNEYVAFVKELPTLPSTDGTYTLKCTVSGSTKTIFWLADT